MTQTKPLPDHAYIFGFSLILEIGPARFEKITKEFSSPKEAWLAPEKELLEKGVDQKTANLFIQKRKEISLEKEFENFSKRPYYFITKKDSLYPSRLKEIKTAPYVLFCYGDIQLLAKKQLAVVGTRMPTSYGKTATEKICQGIINAGLLITSGMANGIDTIAHNVAMEMGSPTIAVLGEGFEQARKNFNFKKTMDDIVRSGGLIVSEYHPWARATKFTFPARNRIISGLSLGVLVIEAGEKSGSLITANCALEQNREVFAVPGSIFSSQSIGTNLLIKQGAQLVSSQNDILTALNFMPSSSKQTTLPQFENETEKTIYSLLTLEPSHIDALAKKCCLDPNNISAILSLMELRGIAKNIGGGMFIKQ